MRKYRIADGWTPGTCSAWCPGFRLEFRETSGWNTCSTHFSGVVLARRPAAFILLAAAKLSARVLGATLQFQKARFELATGFCVSGGGAHVGRPGDAALHQVEHLH